MKKVMTRRRLMELAAAFAASTAVAHNVQAQAYPNRTIRLIAPFPAGGGTDSAARIIAARLSELLGQQVVVDNRPGAGSNIGAEAAARRLARDAALRERLGATGRARVAERYPPEREIDGYLEVYRRLIPVRA